MGSGSVDRPYLPAQLLEQWSRRGDPARGEGRPCGEDLIAHAIAPGGERGELPFDLAERGGGTRVERVLEIEPSGLFEKIAAPVIKRTAARNAENEFATLKDLLES